MFVAAHRPQTFFKPFITRNPVREFRIVRSIEDGRHVFLQVIQSLNSSESDVVTTDFVDTDGDDRVIERWSAVAPCSRRTVGQQRPVLIPHGAGGRRLQAVASAVYGNHRSFSKSDDVSGCSQPDGGRAFASVQIWLAAPSKLRRSEGPRRRRFSKAKIPES